MDPVADLARLLAPGEPRSGVRLRQGKIISVATDGTVTITIGGDPTQIPAVAIASHVCPIPGAACWIAVDGRDAFVIATLQSTGPAHGSQRADAVQSIPNGVYTALSWATRGGIIARGVDHGSTGLTIKIPGLYLCTASLILASNATGFRVLRLSTNGSLSSSPGIIATPALAASPQLSVSHVVPLTVGHVVGAQALQTSGNALDTVVNSASGVLTATWLGPKP